MAVLNGHKGGISDLSWAPDGFFVASASDDQTVRIWNALNV